MHTFAIEATDSEGNVYTDEVCIQVVDRAAIDVSLLAGWEAMRQALIIGNIDDAVSHFESDRRETYAKFFQLIPRDRMSSVIPGTDRMELVEVLDGKARYVVDIDIEVNGVPATASSYIIFTTNEDGLWKISLF
jgi:hypothetical protein